MTDARTGPARRPADDATDPDGAALPGRGGSATGRGDDASGSGGGVLAGRGGSATGRGDDASGSGGGVLAGRGGSATGRGDDASGSGGGVLAGRGGSATGRGDVPAGPEESSRGGGREAPGTAVLVAGDGPGHEGADAGRGGRLLPHEECGRLERRLRHAVSGFVDEPRAAVEEADRAVEELGARVTEAVERRRRTLRGSWRSGGADGSGAAADTEQLRLALRDYRELADRLLSL
ncbi:hypothetical protein ACFZDK_06535 [Streptomyces sp. NPDC007901]|uniref:hypothetical protein n=1 Tax=Streptomyces sp. NPDC007901 TaxID=3364785 RepID=UPI0036E151D5